jgi:hypothetical protein
MPDNKFTLSNSDVYKCVYRIDNFNRGIKLWVNPQKINEDIFIKIELHKGDKKLTYKNWNNSIGKFLKYTKRKPLDIIFGKADRILFICCIKSDNKQNELAINQENIKPFIINMEYLSIYPIVIE